MQPLPANAWGLLCAATTPDFRQLHTPHDCIPENRGGCPGACTSLSCSWVLEGPPRRLLARLAMAFEGPAPPSLGVQASPPVTKPRRDILMDGDRYQAY